MAVWFLLALLAGGVQAATVQGIVLDQFTGRPLARALVTIKSIQGYGAAGGSTRTNATGAFVFSSAGAGAFLIAASRPGFATAKYGQKSWSSAGVPILLQESDSTFIELRLHRLGAISGTVWDENEIGFPEQDVFAYKAMRPPKLAGRRKTDDRGIFRISGLDPGQYFIRSGPKALDDDTGLLPTFWKDSATVEEARSIAVQLDETAPDINFRPHFGKLCRLSGRVFPAAAVTLVSDMGPLASSGGGEQFTFEHLAPGTYELYAEGVMGRTAVASWQRISIERDRGDVQLYLRPLPLVETELEDEQGKLDRRAAQVIIRRKDLAGAGPVLTLKDQRNSVLPGRWEVAVAPSPSYFPVAITARGDVNTRGGRADGWNEVVIEGGLSLNIKLSSKPASVHGRVIASGRPSAGAPVYLETWDVENKRRAGDLRAVLTNLQGEYRFIGLPPGNYRVLSTFDIEDPDQDTMEAAHAKSLELKERTDTLADLDLYTR